MLTIGIAITGGIIASYLLIFKVLGLRVISSNEVAVVEKWWSPKGSLYNAIIALHGEAGYLPDMLRGGTDIISTLLNLVTLEKVGVDDRSIDAKGHGIHTGIPMLSIPKSQRNNKFC